MEHAPCGYRRKKAKRRSKYKTVVVKELPSLSEGNQDTSSAHSVNGEKGRPCRNSYEASRLQGNGSTADSTCSGALRRALGVIAREQKQSQAKHSPFNRLLLERKKKMNGRRRGVDPTSAGTGSTRADRSATEPPQGRRPRGSVTSARLRPPQPTRGLYAPRRRPASACLLFPGRAAGIVSGVTLATSEEIDILSQQRNSEMGKHTVITGQVAARIA